MDETERQLALGRNFRMSLQRAGLTAAELADRLDVRPQTVGNWKKRGVSASAAVAVAELLGVDAAKIADLRAQAHIAEPVIMGYMTSEPAPERPERPRRSKEALLRRLLDADLSPSDIDTLYRLIDSFDQTRGG